MPLVALAGSDSLGIVRTVVNRQVKSYHAVRAVDVVIQPLVFAGFGVSDAVPEERLASRGGILVRGGIVNRKEEGVNLRASVVVGVDVVVGARLVIRLAVAVGPDEGVVSGLGE